MGKTVKHEENDGKSMGKSEKLEVFLINTWIFPWIFHDFPTDRRKKTIGKLVLFVKQNDGGRLFEDHPSGMQWLP